MQFLIWSVEHRAWWCPLRRGYTTLIAKAGKYDEAEALEIAKGDLRPTHLNVLIPLESLDRGPLANELVNMGERLLLEEVRTWLGPTDTDVKRNASLAVAAINGSELLLDALAATLLFHSGGEWNADRREQWRTFTGSDEATLVVLCNLVRASLMKYAALTADARAEAWTRAPGDLTQEQILADIKAAEARILGVKPP